MNPITTIRPDFFRDFQACRSSILRGTFTDVTNHIDRVVYPAINLEIPDDIRKELIDGLQFLLARKVHVKHLFARAMYKGMIASNKIHSDYVMGTTYACQVYLSEHWPKDTGTSFWKHTQHGMVHTPSTPVHEIDCNDLSQFSRVVTVQAAPNLLLAHRGDMWHLAEPIGGWGTEPSNARLVLTCFFNVS